MKVKEVMITKYPKLYKDDPIDKVIQTLTKVPEASLPVIDRNNKIIGEIDQHELLLLDIGKEEFERNELNLKRIKSLFSKSKKYVSDLMTTHDLTITPNQEIVEAAKLMYEEDISMLPVVNEKGKLVGIVTDIAILKKYKQILGAKK